ncbi:MAG: hypothetical protein GY941_18915 [Planctomycetes bacterium]|nr:hypothetical protein [Planctomycetota bacterium]
MVAIQTPEEQLKLTIGTLMWDNVVLRSQLEVEQMKIKDLEREKKDTASKAK